VLHVLLDLITVKCFVMNKDYEASHYKILFSLPVLLAP